MSRGFGYCHLAGGSKAGDANAGDDNCDVKSSASSAASAKKCSSSPNTAPWW